MSVCKVKYTGTALPTGSTTETLFDSSGMPGYVIVWRYAYSISNSHGGDVVGSFSTDGGTTWTEFYRNTLAATDFDHVGDVDVAPYKDVKFEWENGGTTQARFVVQQVLASDQTDSEAENNPLNILGDDLELWLRSDVGVTQSGTVSEWADVLSGSGRTFSQGTAGSRPTYNASDANWGGLPSLTFDGVDDKLTSDDAASVWKFLTDGTGGGAIVVYRADSATSSDAFGVLFGAANSVSTIRFGMFSRTTDQIHFGVSNGAANIIGNSASGAEDVNHWFGAWYEEGRAGNEYELFLDGLSASTGDSLGSPSASDPTEAVAIGDNPPGATNSFAGEIVEVIAFSVYPTAAQLTALQAYIERRYGLWTPASIFGSGLHTWLRSDDITGVADGGTVAAWTDRSGNGHDFSQATEASKPTYNASDANWRGLPSLTFDGTDDKLTSDEAASVWKFLTDGTGGGAIVVYRPNEADNGHLFGPWDGANPAMRLMYNPVNTRTLYQVTNDTVNLFVLPGSDSQTNDANTYIMGAYEEGRAGNEAAAWRNGVEIQTGNSAAAPSVNDPAATASIGSNGVAGDPFTGEILEIIIVSRYPTASELTRLASYMSRRYGL